jgi:ribosome assembly protein YihI (activator of Der GTPase)
LPSHRSANRQSPDEKRQNYAENPKIGSRPKISGNNHVKTVKKQDREKPGWDNKG